MKKLTNLQYAIVNLLGIALGMDKKSYEERLKYAEKNNWKAQISEMEICDNNGESTIEQIEIIEAINMYNEVKNGCTSKKMWIDMSCSGATIHELLTRTISKKTSIVGKSLRKKKILDLYTDLFNTYKLKCMEEGVSPTIDGIAEITRKLLKEGIIPWFYNGEATMKKLVGKKGLEIFRKIYAQALPGSEGFRQATLNGWNSKAYSYQWNGPDGAQIEFCVQSDPKLMQAYIDTKCELNYMLTENEPREMWLEDKNGELYRNTGVKCLGANLTHSIDRYCLFEVVRMVHMTKGRALEILAKSAMSEKSWEESEQLVRLYECYKKQNIVSVRWLYLIEENMCKLPEDVHSELMKITENELGSKEFDIMVIHDAYGCTVNHMNRLRRTANFVLASLYKSTIIDYWNEQLGLNIPISEYKEEVYEQILEADYLMA